MNPHIHTSGTQAGEFRSTGTQSPAEPEDFRPATLDALIKAFGSEPEPFTWHY
jgi:hypothetical protein